MKKITLLPLLLGAIAFSDAHALTISSDTNTYLAPSYGEQVLNTILENWQKPQVEVSGRTAITIRIGKDGRPFSCEIRQHSNSIEVDDSICQTVAKIKQFAPLEAQDTGEIYISFIHDNTPFLPKTTEQNKATTPITAEMIKTDITGKEEIETIKNPIDNPIEEIQENSQSNIDSSPLAGELPIAEIPPVITSIEHSKEANNIVTNASDITSEPIKKNSIPKNEASVQTLPLATESQPKTLNISRQEALMPPSATLTDPAVITQTYSQKILAQTNTKIRIPSNVNGTFQVIARIDLLANGTLKNVSINKSSKNAIIDEEILRVLKNEINYPPLPNKSDQSLWLTFNIKK